MVSNQKAIFKKFLMINVISEDIMKKTDENLQSTTSRSSEDKMREFEIVELSVLKYRPHLNYMIQR